jgi:glycosyltransferase involved in cell wall biosynthesis
MSGNVRPPSVDKAAETGKRPVSVLIIGPSLDILGGQAVQVSRLLKVLATVPSLRVTFFPINPRPPKPLLWIRKIPFLRTAFNFGLYASRLVFETSRHEVIHIFSAGLTSYAMWTLPAMLLGKLYRKRIILNYHDGQAEQHMNEWRTAIPSFGLADRMVTPSYFLVDVFAKYGIKAKSIFNIIDASQFIYRKRSKLRPVFMTNRILEPLYNVGCILRAFSIIQERYPEASLTVAHDGVCRPELEKLAAELRLKNTRFIGRVPHEKIAELYNQTEIYLTSSNFDCMPVSLLECFAAGVPIVSTNAGGIPYVVTDRESGLLVEVNDHEAMAARAIEYLENPDLVERMTDRGLEEVKKYHCDPVRDQWTELYLELAAEKRSTSGKASGAQQVLTQT